MLHGQTVPYYYFELIRRAMSRRRAAAAELGKLELPLMVSHARRRAPSRAREPRARGSLAI